MLKYGKKIYIAGNQFKLKPILAFILKFVKKMLT